MARPVCPACRGTGRRRVLVALLPLDAEHARPLWNTRQCLTCAGTGSYRPYAHPRTTA